MNKEITEDRGAVSMTKAVEIGASSAYKFGMLWLNPNWQKPNWQNPNHRIPNGRVESLSIIGRDYVILNQVGIQSCRVQSQSQFFVNLKWQIKKKMISLELLTNAQLQLVCLES